MAWRCFCLMIQSDSTAASIGGKMSGRPKAVSLANRQWLHRLHHVPLCFSHLDVSVKPSVGMK